MKIARILASVMILLCLSSPVLAAPSVLTITQSKVSALGHRFEDKAKGDVAFVLDLIKERLNGKAILVVDDSAIGALSTSGISDISVAERADILAATKEFKSKYIMLVSLKESWDYTSLMTPNVTADIQCRIIDVANNKYLINSSEKMTDTTSSARKVIRKTIVPILNDMDKLTLSD